jgi:hypothetical protein
VPGRRFAAAHAWLAARVALLVRRGSAETVFAFHAWDAQACYCHDPAGNIVELIAHADVPSDRPPDAPFEPCELAGISELGIVAPDPAATVRAVSDGLGLELWDGSTRDAAALAFVGCRAHTLIVCAPGRGWLPTGRAAEVFPITVTLSGSPRRGSAQIAPAALTISAA